MKKLLLLASLFVLGACSHQAKDSDQVVYVGDNTKVVTIVSKLPYPKDLAYDHLAIQSDKEPYEVKVYLSGKTKDEEGLEEAANQAFQEISNVGIVSFYDTDSDALIRQYEK